MTAQRYGLCSCYGDRHSSGSVFFFLPLSLAINWFCRAKKEVSGWVGVTLLFDCSTKFGFARAQRFGAGISCDCGDRRSVRRTRFPRSHFRGADFTWHHTGRLGPNTQERRLIGWLVMNSSPQWLPLRNVLTARIGFLLQWKSFIKI